jgi:FeS assembly SUF system protein
MKENAVSDKTRAGAAGTASQQARDPQEIESQVVEVLRTVYDPEIPVDIYELGLVYSVEASAAGDVTVKMTLTSPACPVAGSLPGEVEEKVGALPVVRSARVELVWEPMWNKDMMSDAAKLKLGFY